MGNHLQKLAGQLDWLDPLFITMTTATINATFPFIVDLWLKSAGWGKNLRVSAVTHPVGLLTLILSSRFCSFLHHERRSDDAYLNADLWLTGCV